MRTPMVTRTWKNTSTKQNHNSIEIHWYMDYRRRLLFPSRSSYRSTRLHKNIRSFGLRKFVLMHPLAVSVRRAVIVHYLESFETEVHSRFAKCQRYKRPYHGASDNEPGFVPFPRILFGLPEFRDRTNHVSGDNVELHADSPGLISLLVMVEP